MGTCFGCNLRQELKERDLIPFIDWYLKAMEQGLRSFMLPEVVLRRRLHITNTVVRERKSKTDYVRILKASLDRRRKEKIQRGCE